MSCMKEQWAMQYEEEPVDRIGELMAERRRIQMEIRLGQQAEADITEKIECAKAEEGRRA